MKPPPRVQPFSMNGARRLVLCIMLAAWGGLSPVITEAGSSIRVGVYNFDPLVFVDRDGNPQGLFIDVLLHVAALEKWTIQWVPGTWKESLDRVMAGEIDLLVSIAFSAERAEKLDFTENFVFLDWGLVYRKKGSSIQTVLDLEGKTVSVLRGSIYTTGFKHLLDQFGISCTLAEKDEYTEVFRSVDTGESQAGINAQVYGMKIEDNYAIERTNIFFSPVKIRFAAPRGRQPEVLNTLDRHLSKMKADSGSLYYSLVDKWVGLYGKKEIFPGWLVWVMAGMALLLSIFFLFSLVLKKRVDTRTREVRHACNELLQEVSERRRVEAELKLELEQNQAWAEISKALLSHQYDIKKISDITLAYARSLTQSRDGFVSSIDRKTLDNVGHTLTEMLGDTCRIKNQTFPVGPDGWYGGLWGHALNTGKPFFVNNPSTHPSTKGLPQGHIPLDNFLAVPVLLDERPAGLVALANSDRGYTANEVATVQRIADLYALALHRYYYELDKESIESHLKIAQKMEAMGTLASGIAHDFNNILSPIIGFAEMLMEDLPADASLHEGAEEILKASLRAKDLVKQILAFSRQSSERIRPMQLQPVLKEALKLLRASIPTSIDICWELNPGCGPVKADPTQIHQIVMNLVTNAFHALEDKGGKLEITLGQVSLKQDSDLFPELIPGEYAQLTVSDSGMGIEKAILDKVFDPYFTTKGKNKGTGLGLSVVMGIVKRCHGDIRIYSEPGQGTRVHVYLPVIVTDVATDTEQDVLPVAGKTERILLVDDDESITRMMRLMLERLNYRVTVRTGSAEALALFRQCPDEFDLVITDMTMPHMTGDRLSQEIRKIRSDIPIIVCTGFSDRINEELCRSLGIQGLVMKPVIQRDLAQALKKALGTGQGKGI